MAKFYDTCSLLFLQQEVFKDDKFYISDITLEELEDIKSSGYKDEDTKYSARKLINLLDENRDKYEVIVFNRSMLPANLDPNSNDTKIIGCAKSIDDGNLIFVTKDIACNRRAEACGLYTIFIKEELLDDYSGYKVIEMNDIELGAFYNTTLQENFNLYNLLVNEYLLIKYDGKIVEAYQWKNDKYNKINITAVKSKMFGKVLPKDFYQQIALHSLFNNQLTMLRGPAGTGKTLLAFAYMFHKLEEGEIDKIIVFCNTVATKGSAKLGYYPGDRTEKLLDSQIGNLLISKLGDRVAVERLVDDGILVLLPMSDIRGYDTSGMKAAVYISEAQNLDIELMRLAIQRVGDDSICIIDGDFTHQVDMSMYAGVFNGMRRASKVFRNCECYGEVELVEIYRSKLAKIAEEM